MTNSSRSIFGRRATGTRLGRQTRLNLEQLEDRLTPSITDMTGVASLFPRHAGATILYLNFDGNTAQGVSSFQSTTGNRTSDIHEILFRVSEIFAPFDVQVERIYGNGSLDTSSNGNSTIFIGDKTSNGTGVNNGTYAVTPYANCDFPGPTNGISHRPNSNSYDVAYVDPVYGSSLLSWNNTTIARAIAHEAGHTFGLAHVLTSPDQEVMSYDATNTRFVNKTFNITTINNSGTSTSSDTTMQPEWHIDVPYIFGTFSFPVNITTQNSYTYLQTVLGARSTAGDLANVADATAVDASYADGGMWTANTGFNLTAYIQRSGDFDVYALNTVTAKTVQIDVKQIAGSTLDPVVMIFNSNGQNLLAFNDDGGGYPNSRLIFSTTAGQSYRIVVGSYGDISTGGYQLTVNNYYPYLSTIGIAQLVALPVSYAETAPVSGATATPVTTLQASRLTTMAFAGGGSGLAEDAGLGSLSAHLAQQLHASQDTHAAGLLHVLEDSPLAWHW
ncbi:MAG TPA: hypothetical protein VE988_06915 [Gemmataceae bacterium]|nr:hypothetical protein [Gemmataceae bacterium]